ncbi:MAG: alpha/beta fold hydrolase [Bacteroidetes bacterium]|nr:MAG: alpha/beta fold hydrolase [Bacteroidota bacterium]
MKRLRNVLKWTGIFLGVLVAVYLLGPTPALPTFSDKMPDIKGSPAEIAQNLAMRESKVPRLKKDNQARIVWANDTVQAQTEFCIVYLHGFFASYREGMPAVQQLAQHYKANLVCNRMAGHGMDDKDAMLATSPESMWASAQEALAIGQKVGKKIILVGTSTGGSLALLLASKYPNLMRAVVVYSPLIDFYQKEIWLLYKPWGLQIANLLNGNPYLQQNYAPKVRPYWTTEYRVEGAIALTTLIANTMHYKTFEKVKTPIFVGTYYKDEAHQDMVVSVKAIRGMFEQLGTEAGKKKIVFFPESGHHVIGSDLRAKKIEKVSEETIAFLKTVL